MPKNQDDLKMYEDMLDELMSEYPDVEESVLSLKEDLADLEMPEGEEDLEMDMEELPLEEMPMPDEMPMEEEELEEDEDEDEDEMAVLPKF